jgi:hypothetical protein
MDRLAVMKAIFGSSSAGRELRIKNTRKNENEKNEEIARVKEE